MEAPLSNTTSTDNLGELDRKVFEKYYFNNSAIQTEMIDVNKLNPGIYFLKFFSGDKFLVRKIVKEF